MATPSAKFTISLTDQTSKPAQSAAKALSNLQASIKRNTQELSAMNKAMRQLKAGGVTSGKAFDELTQRIAKHKAKLAGVQSKYVELGGTFRKSKSTFRGTGASFDSLSKSASGLPGPLGAVGGKLGALSAMTAGGLIVAGLAAISAAMLAMAAATTVATLALLKFAVAQSGARRSELLHLEGLTTIRRGFFLAGGSATGMQLAIDRVSASSSLGRAKIAQYAEQLHRTRIRGADLEAALGAMAATAAVQGEAQARRFRGMAAGAQRAGRSVQALSAVVQARIGGIARKMFIDLNVQIVKFRENISFIFSGLDLESVSEGLTKIVGLFARNTVIGSALRRLVSRIFQPMLDALPRLAPLAQAFFEGALLGALLVENGVLRVRVALKRAFGGSDVLKGVDGLKLAMYAGVFVVGALAGGLVALAVILGGVALLMLAFASPFILVGLAIAGLVALVVKLGKIFTETDWSGLGGRIIEGLVSGIRSGIGAVRAAVSGVALAAKSALTLALGIASPSRVFAELGRQIPRGLAVGVDQAAPIAAASVADVVGLPGSVDAAGPRRGGSVSIGELHIHAESSEPRDLASSLRDELARVLEGVSIELGAAS